MNNTPQPDKPTILLVEDDNFITTFLVDQMGDKYNTLITGTTKDAEQELKKNNISLIALDLLLPDENGFALLERIRQPDSPYKNIPVIIITNFDNKEDIERARGLGVKEYLVKAEFTPQDIVKKIDEVLNS